MDKKLSIFIKEKRIEAGLTQQQVASHLGYSSPQFISNWERGISHPPIETLKQIGKLYGIPAEELYDVLLYTSIEDVKKSLRAKFNNSDKKFRSF